MVVLASAAATATAAFNELDKIVNALESGGQLELGNELAEAGAGDPQTIMLVGSDAPTPGTEGQHGNKQGERRSDTIILARLDPSRGSTALLSLPRDLKVQIPGHGTDKLNAAYEIGGPRLALQTVKQLTGLRINHVIDIDFGGFEKAVDKLGCVYADVDRGYFSPGLDYAYINLDPGYQQLCGADALSYVRFRHEDTDLVRSARQQDFLRQAKQQISVGRLVGDRDELIGIFGEYTDSDVNSRSSALRLLKLVIASVDQPIREVPFEADLGQVYVTASDQQVQKLADDFLGAEPPPQPSIATGSGGSSKSKKKKKQQDAGETGAGEASLQDATEAGQAQAQQVESQGAKLPIFYPTKVAAGSAFNEEPNAYRIPVKGEGKQAAYRIVVDRGKLGEFYGIQGTTWKDPPILGDPTVTRKIGGRDFELHYDGDRLRLVAWRAKDAVYWLSNTLVQSLSEKEMLEIAASTREL